MAGSTSHAVPMCCDLTQQSEERKHARREKFPAESRKLVAFVPKPAVGLGLTGCTNAVLHGFGFWTRKVIGRKSPAEKHNWRSRCRKHHERKYIKYQIISAVAGNVLPSLLIVPWAKCGQDSVPGLIDSRTSLFGTHRQAAISEVDCSYSYRMLQDATGLKMLNWSKLIGV